MCFYRGTNRIFIKLTALLVVIAFMANFVFTDVWAMSVDPASGTYFADGPGEADFAFLDAETFSIPSHLGQVVDHYKGSSGRTVVHIQDAHCNLFAQKKISDIIDYLNTEYGIRTLNLEGGAGEYDLTSFTSISDSDIRREVSEHFVRTGDINGAEFFAVNNPERVTLWGVEDGELYLRNLEVYRDSLSYRDEAALILKGLEDTLDALKKNVYGRDLMDLEAGEMEFRDYLRSLVRHARSFGAEVANHANVYLLSRTLDAEKTVDFNKANIERNAIIGELEKRFSRNELRELVERSLQFRTKRISTGEFYSYVAQKALFYRIDLDRYPAFSAYLNYVNLYDSVDRREVMEELEVLERDVREKMYTSDIQRELDGLSMKLALLKNIFAMRITKNDYDRYLGNKEGFLSANFSDFIAEKAPRYGIKWSAPRNLADLDGYLSRITSFYEYSFSRDEVFLRNMVFFEGSPAGNKDGSGGEIHASSVLMTGGFHTDNLCRLLREEEISYISIIPCFTSDDGYVSPYFDLMAGKRHFNMERIFNTVIARVSALAILNKLSELGPEVLGQAEVDAFKLTIFIESRLREIKKEQGVERPALELTYRTGEAVRDNNGRVVVFALDADMDENGELINSPVIKPIYVDELLSHLGFEGRTLRPLLEEVTPSPEAPLDPRAGFLDTYMQKIMGIFTLAGSAFFTAAMWISGDLSIAARITGLISIVVGLIVTASYFHQRGGERSKAISLLPAIAAVALLQFLPWASRPSVQEHDAHIVQQTEVSDHGTALFVNVYYHSAAVEQWPSEEYSEILEKVAWVVWDENKRELNKAGTQEEFDLIVLRLVKAGIINRVISGRRREFGRSITKVIEKKWAFEGVTNKWERGEDGVMRPRDTSYRNDPLFLRAKEATNKYLTSFWFDPTHSSKWFWAPEVLRRRGRVTGDPGWAKDLEVVGLASGHRFARDRSDDVLDVVYRRNRMGLSRGQRSLIEGAIVAIKRGDGDFRIIVPAREADGVIRVLERFESAYEQKMLKLLEELSLHSELSHDDMIKAAPEEIREARKKYETDPLNMSQKEIALFQWDHITTRQRVIDNIIRNMRKEGRREREKPVSVKSVAGFFQAPFSPGSWLATRGFKGWPAWNLLMARTEPGTSPVTVDRHSTPEIETSPFGMADEGSKERGYAGKTKHVAWIEDGKKIRYDKVIEGESEEFRKWNSDHENAHKDLDDIFPGSSDAAREIAATVLAFRDMDEVGDRHIRSLLVAMGQDPDKVPKFLGERNLISGAAGMIADINPALRKDMSDPAGRKEILEEARKLVSDMLFYDSIKQQMRTHHGMLDDPETSPFTDLYGELNEIFNDICKAAGVEGATLFLLEDDAPTAFAYARYKMVAISIGLLKELASKGELTRDTVAFVLAHEVRHIAQKKLTSKLQAGAFKVRFAQEIDSDLWGLNVMNAAGYDVLKASKIFEVLKDLDKTPAFLKPVIEVAGEHLPHDKRIKMMTDVVNSANWVKAGKPSRFSKKVESQIGMATPLRQLLEKVTAKVENFEDLEKLLPEIAAYSQDAPVLIAYGISRIAEVRAKELKEKQEVLLEGVEVDEVLFDPDRFLKVLNFMLVSDEEMIDRYLKRESHKTDREVMAHLRDNDDFRNFKKAFDVGRKGFMGLTGEKLGDLNYDLVSVIMLFRSSGIADSLWPISESRRSDLLEAGLKEHLFTENDPKGNLKIAKAIRVFPFYFVEKKISLGLREFYSECIKSIWRENVSLSGAYTWEDWEEVLMTVSQLGELAGIQKRERDPFKQIYVRHAVDSVLQNERLTDREKADIIVRFPFLAREEGLRYICEYYVGGDFSDKDVEDILVGETKEFEGTSRLIYNAIGEGAIEGLINSDPRLLDLFAGGRIGDSLDRNLAVIYEAWKKEESPERRISALRALLKYYAQKVTRRDFNEDALSRALIEELRRLDTAEIDKRVEEALKRAGVEADKEKVQGLSRIVKVRILFFDEGGMMERGSLYGEIIGQAGVDGELIEELQRLDKAEIDKRVEEALKRGGMEEDTERIKGLSGVEKVRFLFIYEGEMMDRGMISRPVVTDDDLEVLGKFLNSGYLLGRLNEDYGMDIVESRSSDARKGIVEKAGSAVKEAVQLNKEENIEVVKSWADYVLFLNMRLFLAKINAGTGENKNKILRTLQDKFNIFLIEKRSDIRYIQKIRISDQTNYFSLMKSTLLDGKNAEMSISEKYEPLLRKLLAMPFYADRTDLLGLDTKDMLQVLSFVFESTLGFDELFNYIDSYLPKGYLRNFILVALLAREIVGLDPAEDDPFNVATIRRMVIENSAFREKAKKISSGLVPDRRLSLINYILFGYFINKTRGKKVSGIGGEDGFWIATPWGSLDLSSYAIKAGPEKRLPLIIRIRQIFDLTNIAGKMQLFFNKWKVPAKILLKLALLSGAPKIFLMDAVEPFDLQRHRWSSPLTGVMVRLRRLFNPHSSLLFLNKRVLGVRPLKEELTARRVDLAILEKEGGMDFALTMLRNQYKEELFELVFTNKEYSFLREIMLRLYFARLRKKAGIGSIDVLFFDLNHPNKMAQLDAVIPEIIAESEFGSILSSPHMSFEEKLSYVSSELFQDAQPARDKYLEILLDSELVSVSDSEERISAIKKASSKFFNPYFTQKYLLKALELNAEISPDIAPEEEMALIKEFFPEKSSFRDDLLLTVLARTETFPQYSRVVSMLYSEKKQVLEEEKLVEQVYYEEKFKIIFENLSVSDKKDVTLWMLGIKEMPIFLREYQEMLGVSFERFRDMYKINPERGKYSHAGESSRNAFIEEMFLGPNGVINNDKEFTAFMNEVMNRVLKDLKGRDISKGLLKKIFRAVMAESDSMRRLAIVKALAFNLAPIMGRDKYERSSALEIVPKLLESLGIIGVKVGQILAFSDDVNISEDLRAVLKDMGSKASPLTKKLVFETLINMDQDGQFQRIGDLLGSASIKVVYEAFSAEGDRVALKIKRPDVVHNLAADLDFFKRVCGFLRAEGVKIPKGFEHRASEGIERDADFVREIENAKQLKEQIAEINSENRYRCSSGTEVEFSVPSVMEEGSDDKIIVSQLIVGKDLDSEKALLETGIVDEEEIADLKRIIFDFLMTQLFGKGFYLSDPHGGNFRIARENGKIKVYLIDVGAMETQQQSMEEFRDMLNELTYIQRGLKASDKYVWLALFFEKTGYLTSNMNKDEVLETIIDKMPEEYRPFDNIGELKRGMIRRVMGKYLENIADNIRKRGEEQQTTPVDVRLAAITDGGYGLLIDEEDFMDKVVPTDAPDIASPGSWFAAKEWVRKAFITEAGLPLGIAALFLFFLPPVVVPFVAAGLFAAPHLRLRYNEETGRRYLSLAEHTSWPVVLAFSVLTGTASAGTLILSSVWWGIAGIAVLMAAHGAWNLWATRAPVSRDIPLSERRRVLDQEEAWLRDVFGATRHELEDIGFRRDELDVVSDKVIMSPDESFSFQERPEQMRWLRGKIREIIQRKLNDREGPEMVIYGIGLGSGLVEEPVEALEVVEALYDVLKEMGQDATGWNVLFVGIDIRDDVLSGARDAFSRMMNKYPGLTMRTGKANALDKEALKRIFEDKDNGGEGQKADIILNRHVHYGNLSAAKGFFGETVIKRPASRIQRKSLINAYVQIKNLTDVLGKKGGLFVVEDILDLKAPGNPHLVIPGADVQIDSHSGIYEFTGDDISMSLPEFIEATAKSALPREMDEILPTDMIEQNIRDIAGGVIVSPEIYPEAREDLEAILSKEHLSDEDRLVVLFFVIASSMIAYERAATYEDVQRFKVSQGLADMFADVCQSMYPDISRKAAAYRNSVELGVRGPIERNFQDLLRGLRRNGWFFEVDGLRGEITTGRVAAREEYVFDADIGRGKAAKKVHLLMVEPVIRNKMLRGHGGTYRRVSDLLSPGFMMADAPPVVFMAHSEYEVKDMFRAVYAVEGYYRDHNPAMTLRKRHFESRGMTSPSIDEISALTLMGIADHEFTHRLHSMFENEYAADPEVSETGEFLPGELKDRNTYSETVAFLGWLAGGDILFRLSEAAAVAIGFQDPEIKQSMEQELGDSIDPHGSAINFIIRRLASSVHVDLGDDMSGMDEAVSEWMSLTEEDLKDRVEKILLSIVPPSYGEAFVESLRQALYREGKGTALSHFEEKGYLSATRWPQADVIERLNNEVLEEIREDVASPAGVPQDAGMSVPGAITTQEIAAPVGEDMVATITEIPASVGEDLAYRDIPVDPLDQKMIVQMRAALDAADDINNGFADWIITPTHRDKARPSNQKTAVTSAISREYRRSQGYTGDIRINGYVYDEDMLEDNLKETFRTTLVQMGNAMARAPEKDARAIVFIPHDKYDLGVSALEGLDLPYKDRVRIVKIDGMDPTGLVNEMHHADIGRELLNYDRLLDGPDGKIDHERARAVAGRIVSHIRSVTMAPNSSVFEGEPMVVVNNFLKGITALPAMERKNLERWRETHETFLAVRRSL